MGCKPTETMQISFPLIETDRLRLRLPGSEDINSIHTIWSDPEVTRFIPIVLFKTHEEIGQFVELSLQRWRERGFGIFTVLSKETGEMVGYCGLQYLDTTPEIEIYYGFSKESWNKGYATEAAKAVMRFGFEELKVKNITAITLPGNLASQKVLRKLGLERTGENQVFHDTECVYFSASRENYSSNGDGYKLSYT